MNNENIFIFFREEQPYWQINQAAMGRRMYGRMRGREGRTRVTPARLRSAMPEYDSGAIDKAGAEHS